jgi:hypothetical protein
LDKIEQEFVDDVTLIDEASGAVAEKGFEEFNGTIVFKSDSLIDDRR